jgi:hypothetical protein
MDFRMMADYQVGDLLLNQHRNQAYKIAGMFESKSVLKSH